MRMGLSRASRHGRAIRPSRLPPANSGTRAFDRGRGVDLRPLAGEHRRPTPRADRAEAVELPDDEHVALSAGPRVPTTFVLKYTLRARPEPAGSHEAVKGGPGHARELGDGRLGHAQLEEAPDFVLLAVES